MTSPTDHFTTQSRCEPSGPGAGKTLIFVVSEDWYFLSHRLPMARAARDLGFRIVVAAGMRDSADRIRQEGFEPVHIPMHRGSISPIEGSVTVAKLIALFRKERPAVIHNIAIQPILQGGLAAQFVPGAKVVNSIAGLGSVLSDQAEETAVKKIVFQVLRFNARRNKSIMIVQNQDDANVLLARGVASPEQLVMIRGSGVDTDYFSPSPEPQGAPVALHVSRLLKDKGVSELVAAARILHEGGSPLRVRIAGAIDPANATSLAAAQIEAWGREGIVEFLGHRSDVRDLWRQAHIGVLASSYGEGLPMSLLEAAASGRPIVTTDLPGCRDLVPEGRTGILVPPRDPEALAAALAELASSPDLRARMGREARHLAEREFSERTVQTAISDLYRRLVREL